MLELYVIACITAATCRDFHLGFVPKEEYTPYLCHSEAMNRYVKQKLPAYPDYQVKRYGCRKPTSKGA